MLLIIFGQLISFLRRNPVIFILYITSIRKSIQEFTIYDGIKKHTHIHEP